MSCIFAEASTTQPESSSEEEGERPSSRGIASESSDSEDDLGTFINVYPLDIENKPEWFEPTFAYATRHTTVERNQSLFTVAAAYSIMTQLIDNQ